jgi:hypothetical protein
MVERAVDMLAVAVQLPAAVLADEASGAAAIASIAQIPDARTFALTKKPASFSPMNEASVGSKCCARLTRSLNDREQSSGTPAARAPPARGGDETTPDGDRGRLAFLFEAVAQSDT